MNKLEITVDKCESSCPEGKRQKLFIAAAEKHADLRDTCINDAYTQIPMHTPFLKRELVLAFTMETHRTY